MLPRLHLFISYPIFCLLTGEVVGLPGLLARGLVQRVLGAVLVPQVEVAEDGVGAVDLTRGARQVEVVREDVAKRRFDLLFMRVVKLASRYVWEPGSLVQQLWSIPYTPKSIDTLEQTKGKRSLPVKTDCR